MKALDAYKRRVIMGGVGVPAASIAQTQPLRLQIRKVDLSSRLSPEDQQIFNEAADRCGFRPRDERNILLKKIEDAGFVPSEKAGAVTFSFQGRAIFSGRPEHYTSAKLRLWT